jgi:hypothetical protein
MSSQQSTDIRSDVQDFILDCLASLPPEQATPMLKTDRWRRIKDWVKDTPALTGERS